MPTKILIEDVLSIGTVKDDTISQRLQKFEESEEPLSTRRNIVVMADEAHRSQYGLEERVRMVTDADGVTHEVIYVNTFF